MARLKSIVELGQKLNRKIVFLGRSLDKYVRAAETVNIINFSKQMDIFKHRDQVQKVLRRIEKEGREKYLIVCTGHQGEPKAILSRIARGELDFKFRPGDLVIFSCQVIPVEINKLNREKLEHSLLSKNVRIFRDVHVSGHGHLEDHRDLLGLLKPQQIIPIHAGPAKGHMLAEFAAKLGLDNTTVVHDGKRIKIE
ncbi:ribonuclease J, partial [Candidatus Woesearchaeota archaeon]|nr:ribonuclease J [Candidatus Woesearchaeota archaeon]